MWWWLIGEGATGLEPRGLEHLEDQPGNVWMLNRARYGLGMSMGFDAGFGAPEALGVRKEAVARCGLVGDDVLSAVVRADDTDVGPWEVEILAAPDPSVGACAARLLETVSWEHPGSAVLGFRTTGADVAAWHPPKDPEDEPVAYCETGFMFGNIRQNFDDEWIDVFACPSPTPLTRLSFELVPGADTPSRIETAPSVPCVEARALAQAPVVVDRLALFRSARHISGNVRCSFDLPLVP
jgi:hypothetical protein